MTEEQLTGEKFAGVKLEFRFKNNISGRILKIGTWEIPLGKGLEYDSNWMNDWIDDRIDPSVFDGLEFIPVKPNPEEPPEEYEPEVLIENDGVPYKVWPVGPARQNEDGNPKHEFFVNQKEDGKLIVECISLMYTDSIIRK